MMISVIVPVYNNAEDIARCLDSILAQELDDIEIVAVNDGSTDASGAILDRYAAKYPNVRVIHKENGGVTSARLRGLSETTGHWIAFVDGDDYIEPDMLERLLKNATTYNAEISHCGYRMVFPSRVDWYYNTGVLTEQPGKQGLYDLLEGRFVEPALWNKLYRRELFDGLAAWMDTSIRVNEDLLMNAFLFRKANMAIHEDFCPYHYILRQGSAMVSQFNEHKLKDPLRVVDILLAEETDPKAREILENRLVYQLIGGATMGLGAQKDSIVPWRKACRKRLQALVPLKGSYFPKRLKILALWAAICPWSYYIVHKVYARIRGTDKKYEVK